MEYSDLSKEELIKKLQEKSHLADAIHAKDSEITKLKKELKELKHQLTFLEHYEIVKEDNKKLNKKLDEAFLIEKEHKEFIESLSNENKNIKESLENTSKELIELRRILELTKQKHAEDISNVKKGYEERLINFDLEVNSLKEIVNKTPDVEKLYKAVDTLTKENKLLVKTGNAHLAAFRNLMKSIQGTMDNAIELESIITENLQNNLGGIK